MVFFVIASLISTIYFSSEHIIYGQNGILTDSDALIYYSNPLDYIDEHINFTGKILKLIPSNQGTYGLQMYQAGDPSRNTIVNYTSPILLSENDCIRVNGITQSLSQYQNTYGAMFSAATILAENIKKIDCSESIEPATKTIVVGETQEQNNIRITLHKVEFSDKNTRAYLTVENKDTIEDIIFHGENSRAMQGKTQFITSDSLDVNYPKIESIIPPGIEEDGVILFEPLDPTQNEEKFRFEVDKGIDKFRFNFNVNTYLEYYNKILEYEPNNINALLNKSIYLGYIGNYSEAMESIDKALEIEPSNSTILNFKEFIILDSDNPTKVIDHYNKILEYEPNNINALLNKGWTYKLLENYTKAIETYDKVLAIDPKNISTLETKGDLLTLIHNYTEAIDTFNKILEIDSKNINATLNIGDNLYNLHNYTGANEYYNRVLAIDPDDKTALSRKNIINAQIS